MLILIILISYNQAIINNLTYYTISVIHKAQAIRRQSRFRKAISVLYSKVLAVPQYERGIRKHFFKRLNTC